MFIDASVNATLLADIGEMYFNGNGVAKDPVEAARLLKTAADQGHAKVQYTLGSMYFHGNGVAKDAAGRPQAEATEAAKLLQLAADQGHAKAQCHLGSMYYIGAGVQEDHFEAARLWKLASAYDQGDQKTRGALNQLTVVGVVL